jgi:hypothetical protein
MWGLIYGSVTGVCSGCARKVYTLGAGIGLPSVGTLIYDSRLARTSFIAQRPEEVAVRLRGEINL